MSTGSALLVNQDGYVVGRVLNRLPQQERRDKVYVPVAGVLSAKTRPEDFARFGEMARRAHLQASPADDATVGAEEQALEIVAEVA